MSEIIDSGVIQVGLDTSSIPAVLDDLSSDITTSVQGGFEEGGSSFGVGLLDGLKGSLSSIGQTVEKSFTTVGLAAGGALATSLFTGYQRYNTIQDSLVAMEVQLGSTIAATKMLDEVLDVVTGTPFNLDQFANAASTMVAFGASAEKIPGYLEAIGEVAATKGGRSNEFAQRLSMSFGQIASLGKITNEELNQMAIAGVPALRILANEFDTTTIEARKMISEGLIPAEQAMDALTKGILEGTDGLAGMTPAMAGTMEGLRETMTGALGGMKSAMARFGAEIIEQIAPALTAAFNATTAVWNKLTSLISEFAFDESSFVQGLTKFLNFIADADTGALDAIFSKLSEMTSLIAPLGAIAGVKGLGALSSLLGPLSGALGALTGPIGMIVAGLGALLVTNDEFMASLSEMGSMLMDAFAPLLDVIMGPLVELMDVISDVVGDLLAAIVPVVAALLEALAPVLDVIVMVAQALAAGLQPAVESLGAIMERSLVPFLEMAGESLADLAVALSPLIELMGEQLGMKLEMMLLSLEPMLAMFAALIPLVVELTNMLMPLIMVFAEIQTGAMRAGMDLLAPFFEGLAGEIVKFSDDVAGAVGLMKDITNFIGASISWLSGNGFNFDTDDDKDQVAGLNDEVEGLASTLTAALTSMTAFAAAISESTNATEAWALGLKDVEAMKGVFGDVIPDDLADKLDGVPEHFGELAHAIDGVDVDDFAAALANGEEGLGDLITQMDEAGASTDTITYTMWALVEAYELGAAGVDLMSESFDEFLKPERREAVNAFTQGVVDLVQSFDSERVRIFGQVLDEQLSESLLQTQLRAWETEQVFKDFGAAVSEAGGWELGADLFDPAAEGARELYEAAAPLQQMFADDLNEAMANSAGGFDAARLAGAEFRQELMEMNPDATTQELNELFELMGADYKSVELAIEMTGQQQAKENLAILMPLIADLPEETQTDVIANVQEGDFVAAMEIAQSSVEDGVESPLTVLEPDVEALVASITQKLTDNPPTTTAVVNKDDAALTALRRDIESAIGTPVVNVKVKYSGTPNSDEIRSVVGQSVSGGRIAGRAGDDYTIERGPNMGGGGEVNMVKVESATFVDGTDLDELAAQVRLGMVLAGESV